MFPRPGLIGAAALSALLSIPPGAALAQASEGSDREDPGANEIDELRSEVKDLREQIRLLQEQVALLTEGMKATPPAPAPVPTPTTAAPQPPMPPVGTASTSRSRNIMNPGITAVLQLIGGTSLDREQEVNGFDLSEVEIAFQSIVDPYALVDLFLTFPADESPEVEEGYVQSLEFPGPLQLKGGRFKNAFGKWNLFHNHASYTVDRPNALENFLGEESLANDGLSLSMLIPNRWDLFIESISEVGTARPGASFNEAERNLTYLQHLKFFFDTSDDSTLEVGLTAAHGRTGPTESLVTAIEDAGLMLEPHTELDSDLQGLDVTFKWKPLALNVYRSFVWQTEMLRSRRDVEVLEGAILAPDTVSSWGGYSYLEWQFAKRWRAGARYDRSGFPDSKGDREWAASGVVRFQPSEFHEIRFQMKHIKRNLLAAARFDGQKDDTRLFFEWIPIIGAHGAHKY